VKMLHGLKYVLLAAIGAAALSGIPTLAQQQPDPQQEQPTVPIPAIHSPLASAADNGDADETTNAQQLIADTRSLTGAEDLSLGTIPLPCSQMWIRIQTIPPGAAIGRRGPP
jgi:hypothetical protein